MKKALFTLLMGICMLGFAKATVIFDPATYSGSLPTGMSIVDIDGVSYLKVAVDGWNTFLDIDNVTIGEKENKMKTTIMHVLGASGWDHDSLRTFVPCQQVSGTDTTQASFINVPDSIEANKLVTEVIPGSTIIDIQFASQQTTGGWDAIVGDTILIGIIETYEGNIIYDPAAHWGETLPAGFDIVKEGDDTLMAVTVDGWNTTFDIELFASGESYNKVKCKMKYEKGTSSLEASGAQSTVKASNGAFQCQINPTPETLTEVIADLTFNSEISTLQMFVQENSAWAEQKGPIIYFSKIEAYYEEPVPVDAPKSATFLKTDMTVEVNGLYDDAYDISEAYAIQRIADGTVDGTDAAKDAEVVKNNDNWGEFLAVWDMNNLYIYLEISDDDALEIADDSEAPWNNDGVEVFVDAQNRRFAGASRIDGEQHQFRFNLGASSPAHGEDTENSIAAVGMSGFFGVNDTTNINYASVKGSNGYSVELAIPWATIFRTSSNTNVDALADATAKVKDGLKIAFEVSILDANAADTRKSILNWSNNTGEDKAYETNEFYGEVTLGGGSSIKNIASENSLKVYPNPASTQIRLSMENVQSVTIYSVVGTLVNETVNTNTIDVSNLTTGVYVIKATDKNGEIAISKFTKK